MNYKDYYEKQAGGNYPVFRGASSQRGYGLGGIFKRFFNYILPVVKTHALPLIKSGAETLGTEAIKTAANIASDAIRGRNFVEASRDHADTAIKNLSKKAESHLTPQTGSGRVNRKRKILSKKQHSAKTRRLKDIFDKL